MPMLTDTHQEELITINDIPERGNARHRAVTFNEIPEEFDDSNEEVTGQQSITIELIGIEHEIEEQSMESKVDYDAHDEIMNEEDNANDDDEYENNVINKK